MSVLQVLHIPDERLRKVAKPVEEVNAEIQLILANQPEHIAAIRPQGEIDFSGTLIRLHIGLEDVDDLIADLDAGFARIV